MPNPFALYESVFHSLEEQIAVINQAGTIVAVNLAWQTFGCQNGMPSEHSWVNSNYLEILLASAATGDRLAEDALKGIAAVMAGKQATFYYEYPCHSPNERRWFTMRVTALQGPDSQGFFIISHHNVTQRKLAEERAEELAMQDPLTGIANRRSFNLSLTREIRSSLRHKAPIGLALIDVDHFKQYNDALGHAAGDECLTQISKVLLAHAQRPNDLAARIGGDEFALILQDTTADSLRLIAESIIKTIRGLNIRVDDTTAITVSIGSVALIPDQQQTAEYLFREADKALYRAKAAGRDQAMYAGDGLCGAGKVGSVPGASER